MKENRTKRVTFRVSEEAIEREDITNMSRELLKTYLKNKDGGLQKNDYIPKSATEQDYVLFG